MIDVKLKNERKVMSALHRHGADLERVPIAHRGSCVIFVIDGKGNRISGPVQNVEQVETNILMAV